jgi:hypothetical protein
MRTTSGGDAKPSASPINTRGVANARRCQRSCTGVRIDDKRSLLPDDEQTVPSGADRFDAAGGPLLPLASTNKETR